MAFDYPRLAQTALRLITRFGAQTTITRNAATYSTSTGQATEVPTVQTVQAAVFPIDSRMIDGTHVLVGDQQAFVAAVGITPPSPGDRFTWNSSDLAVVNAKNLGPSGVYVLYELQVRG